MVSGYVCFFNVFILCLCLSVPNCSTLTVNVWAYSRTWISVRCNSLSLQVKEVISVPWWENPKLMLRILHNKSCMCWNMSGWFSQQWLGLLDLLKWVQLRGVYQSVLRDPKMYPPWPSFPWKGHHRMTCFDTYSKSWFTGDGLDIWSPRCVHCAPLQYMWHWEISCW